MTDYLSLIQALPGATRITQQRDGYWMVAPDLDVVALAKAMSQWGARLSTMTGSMLPDEETAVMYHFFLDNKGINFKVFTHKNKIASISPVLPAAEWIEREITDLFKVEFEGHPHPERLIRPLQLEPGLMREPGGAASKGKE